MTGNGWVFIDDQLADYLLQSIFRTKSSNKVVPLECEARKALNRVHIGGEMYDLDNGVAADSSVVIIIPRGIFQEVGVKLLRKAEESE